MKKTFVFGIISLIVLSLMTCPGYAVSDPVSKNKIYIPYVNFNLSNITYDGKADENGFFTFSISTLSGKIINVAFRQNGIDLHVVLSTPNQGWLAIGWQNKTPSSIYGAGPMVGANIVIGGNNTARDDTGAYAAHNPDKINNIINYSSTINNRGARFEFTFPLASPDPVDQRLSIKSVGFFIFATGISPDLNAGHGGSEQAMYLPNVYIESSKKEGYQNSLANSTSFASTLLVIFSLGILAILVKLKRKYL